MVGAASLKEKEMVATLFCKLANLMRLKIACFGSDTQVTVKCLQVGPGRAVYSLLYNLKTHMGVYVELILYSIAK